MTSKSDMQPSEQLIILKNVFPTIEAVRVHFVVINLLISNICKNLKRKNTR